QTCALPIYVVDPGSLGATPARGCAGVQVGGVEDPGDEGDRLLRAPAPEAAPGGVGPDRAEDDAQAEDRQGPDRASVGQSVQLGGIRQRGGDGTEEALF